VAVDEDSRKFAMPGANARITAEFEVLPSGSFSVSIDKLKNGTIVAVPEFGQPGDTITLTVMPDSGFWLKKGSLEYTESDLISGVQPIDEVSKTFTLPQKNIVVRAEFETLPAGTYSVRVENLINGDITPSQEYVTRGSEVVLKISPASGYLLKQGSLKYRDDGGTERPIDENSGAFYMPESNVVIKALFESLPSGTYPVFIEPAANGRVYARPNHGKKGDKITLVVNPSPGYRLSPGSLLGKTAGGPLTIDEAARQFIMPEEAVIVGAAFETLPGGSYSVSIANLSAGSVIAVPEYGNTGAAISLRVLPNKGYKLKGNTLMYSDAQGNNQVYIDEQSKTFSLPSFNTLVSAEFEALQANTYLVLAEPAENGAIVPRPEYGRIGDEIVLAVTPSPGFKLTPDSLAYTDSRGDRKTINALTGSFDMPADTVTVSGLFERLPGNTYSAGVVPLRNGHITPIPAYGPKDTPIRLAVSPDPGFRLKSGSLAYKGADGKGSGKVDEATRSFTMPDKNVLVEAEFEALPSGVYAIRIGGFPNGSIISVPEFSPAGAPIVLIVKPDPGYRLKDGSLKYRDASGYHSISETKKSFVMPSSDIRITAIFETLPLGNHSVLVVPTANGSIGVAPGYSAPGVPIVLTVIPDTDYRLKPGSLRYWKDGEANNPVILADTAISFPMPDTHVWVSGEFEALPIYKVTVAPLQNGRIVPSPDKGYPGTEIVLQVSPDPNYKLKQDSLKYTDAAGKTTDITDPGRKFILPEGGATVSAAFDPLPPNTYTVRVGTLTNGRITVTPEHGPENTPITLTVQSAPGYRLKAGTLRWEDTSGQSAKIDEGKLNFLLPKKNITIRAEFVSTDASLGDLRMDGITLTGFKPNVFNYRITVPHSITSATISAVPAGAGAVTDLPGGIANLSNLQVFDNSLTIGVTAADGISKLTYNVVITRELIPQVSVTKGAFMARKNVYGVSPFSIGKFEVTQEQWMAVLGAGSNPSKFQSGYNVSGEQWEKRPVESISWYNTLVFCNRLSIAEGKTPVYSIKGTTDPDGWGSPGNGSNSGWDAVQADWDADGYRLPSEMEWLWAAMGADTYDRNKVNTTGFSSDFAGYYKTKDSLEIASYCWSYESYTGTTHEVGKKFPNELDIYDMSGNVAEFCWDWYDDLPAGQHDDYRGPSSAQKLRVAHGGGYNTPKYRVFLSERGDSDTQFPNPTPYAKKDHIGMRVVRSIRALTP
jgi:formylglycine-generating enzyme required for sulfatase activity